MLYKANVNLIVKGDLVQKGDVVELTEEEAQRYAVADLASFVQEEPAPEPAPEVEVPLEEMNKDQLQEKAKALGLTTSGSKADLLERITLHLETEAIVIDEEQLPDNI